MAEEEVKIHVRTEADTRGIDATQAKIRELRAEAEKQRGFAERSASKFGFEDVTARTARASAAAHEREASRLERPINAEQKAAQKTERDERAKAIREQHAAEKDITRERREQAAISRTEETQRQTTGRVLFGGRRRTIQGGLLGGAAAFVGQEAFTEYTERQGIALRAAAQRKMDGREIAIAGSWRGSSSQTLAKVQGLDDDIAHQAARRPELERKAHAGIFDRALGYGAAGAGTGFALSGGNPIGAAFGFVAGAVTGGYKAYAEGAREKDEDRKTLEAKRKKREELEALGKKQVRELDGQIEMDLASHRAERTMSGSRAAFIDTQKKQFLNRYRELRGMNLSDAEATQTAGLEAGTQMRDRQIAAGSGLVDARSGAGDIAAAARWGGMSTPGMGEVTAAIDRLHGTVERHGEAARHINQSVP